MSEYDNWLTKLDDIQQERNDKLDHPIEDDLILSVSTKLADRGDLDYSVLLEYLVRDILGEQVDFTDVISYRDITELLEEAINER